MLLLAPSLRHFLQSLAACDTLTSSFRTFGSHPCPLFPHSLTRYTVSKDLSSPKMESLKDQTAMEKEINPPTTSLEPTTPCEPNVESPSSQQDQEHEIHTLHSQVLAQRNGHPTPPRSTPRHAAQHLTASPSPSLLPDATPQEHRPISRLSCKRSSRQKRDVLKSLQRSLQPKGLPIPPTR